jgi:hypothetical protein
MSNPVMKLCGALRNLGSEPTQNHCAASRRRCRSLDVWRQMKTRKPTFSHCFQRTLLAHCWRWFMCRLRGFGGGMPFRFASPSCSWCHASGVGCLRRNCVKPVLTRKNFGRAGSSVEAATLEKFSEFSVLSVDKKWVVGVSPRQVCSCGSWLKTPFWTQSN